MTLTARGSRALATTAAVFVALLALAVAAPGAARAGWGPPFELTTPGTLDRSGLGVTFAGSGAATTAFTIADVDSPGVAQAYLVGRSPSGTVGQPQALASVDQVLSMAYDGPNLELLAGTAPGNQDCCSAVEAIQVGPSGVAQAPRQLVGGLTGATEAQVLRLGDGQLTAAIATERGVWVAQSSRANRYGSQHRISAADQEPISMSAAWLGGQSTIVAWTAGTGAIGATTPNAIYYATGSRRSAPDGARTAVTVPNGHRIDDLQVVRNGAGATLLWIESWFDGRGRYHSRVEAADLRAKPQVRALSSDGGLAAALSAASDPSGDEAVAWQSCTLGGACSTQAAGRPAKRAFGSARTLGALDPDESPSLAIGTSGQVVIAWVRGGRPVASAGFGAPTTLSSTTYADTPTVAFGPHGQALAAWSQGTLNPSIVAAAFHGR